jgi:hypothetical protein
LAFAQITSVNAATNATRTTRRRAFPSDARMSSRDESPRASSRANSRRRRAVRWTLRSSWEILRRRARY